MPIDVTCEECFTPHRVKREYAGRRFKCRECGGQCHSSNTCLRLCSAHPHRWPESSAREAEKEFQANLQAGQRKVAAL